MLIQKAITRFAHHDVLPHGGGNLGLFVRVVDLQHIMYPVFALARSLFLSLAIQEFTTLYQEIIMLSWALVFFIIALVAAVLGFGGIAGTAAGIAKVLFFVFLVLLVISLVANAVRGRGPTA